MKKIPQKNFLDLVIDTTENGIICIGVIQMKSTDFIPIERKNIPALIDVLSKELPVNNIRNEMDADLQEGGMPQGEIEGCLNHWSNKYIFIKK